MQDPDLILLTVDHDGRIVDVYPKELTAALGRPALEWLDPVDHQGGFEEGLPTALFLDHPLWLKSGRLYLLTIQEREHHATWVLRNVTREVPDQGLLDRSPMPLALWTLANHLLLANDGFYGLVGDQAATLEDAWDPGEFGPRTLTAATAIRPCVFAAPGSDVHLSATLIPCFAEGRPVAILSVYQDITGAVRDAVGREEGITKEMVASILHEARNPLGTVRGFLQLLEAETAGQMKEWCTLSIREVDRAARMLEDANALAEPRAGESDTFSLTEVVESLIETVRLRQNVPEDALLVRLPGDVTVQGSRNLATQILLNLILNGLEAGPPVKVGAEIQGGTVIVSVTDSGSGIPKDVTKRVFEPFFTTKAHGSGLGLHIAKTLAERMGGRVEMTPRAKGGGACFCVVFRAGQQEGEEALCAES